jgi:cobalamin biosynthesis protein CbiG
MQKIAIIQISEAGAAIAAQLQKALGAQNVRRDSIATQWQKYDAFIFIGAMGICVRTIAPYINDKHSDPAVVCIDS